MKEAAKVMVKMVMVMNPKTGNLVNQRLIGKEINSKFHSTPMGTPNNTPPAFLSPYSLLFDGCSNKVFSGFLSAMIATPHSKFNDTAIVTPNNTPPEFILPFSLLFDGCSDKIFSGLLWP